jgi:hypothetical protein
MDGRCRCFVRRRFRIPFRVVFLFLPGEAMRAELIIETAFAEFVVAVGTLGET